VAPILGDRFGGLASDRLALFSIHLPARGRWMWQRRGCLWRSRAARPILLRKRAWGQATGLPIVSETRLNSLVL
jgi:hypothetical protein